MKLFGIFPSISGEQNAFGIGFPSLFVRFYGCSANCYRGTLKQSCDTPEAMEGNKFTEITPKQLAIKVVKVCNDYGISLVTLTGGEPLEQDKDELIEFLEEMMENQLFVSIETNGFEDVEPFIDFPNTTFVVDWKLNSTGIKKKNQISEQYALLGDDDFIKFVVHDQGDLLEAVTIIKEIKDASARPCIGLHSGATMSYQQLFDELKNYKVLEMITINFQAHKLLKLK